jgi:hypothetical protein
MVASQSEGRLRADGKREAPPASVGLTSEARLRANQSSQVRQHQPLLDSPARPGLGPTSPVR